MKAMIFAAASSASRPLGLHGVIMIVALVAAALILVRLFASRRAAHAAPPSPEASAPATAESEPAGPHKIPASGSLGDVDLNSTDPRTAAMLMAIVADKIGAPLNELRFISIKEVRE